MREIELRHRRGLRGGAVMRVVEEELIAAGCAAMLADATHELAIVPLVHEDDVGAGECRGDVELREVVADRAKRGERAAEIVERFFSVIGDEVLHAPGIERLVDDDVVIAREELRNDAAQEVRVAVVPVGNQRVVEQRKFHRVAPIES